MTPDRLDHTVRTRWFDALWADLRQAIPTIRRSPGAPIVAALSLGLGMALATAVFSVVDAMLQPLPYANADRIVRVFAIDIRSQYVVNGTHALHFLGARHLPDLEAVAASRGVYPSIVFGSSGDAGRVSGQWITPNYFEILGVHPAHGRAFTPEDAAFGRQRVIISHSLWQARLGGSEIVGRDVMLDGVPSQVVGVMPEGFNYPGGNRVWFPLSETTIQKDAAVPASQRDFDLIARLAAGATVERAAAEFGVVLSSVKDKVPNSETYAPKVVTLPDDHARGVLRGMQLFFAVVGVVVLLCAVNFATMSLARGMRRRSEIAVRVALGASARRVVALLSAEAVVIAAAGGVAAVAFASWIIHIVGSNFNMGALPVEPTMGWRTITFGIVATVTVGYLFALAPAMQLSRADLRPLLSGGSAATGGARELRSRRGLVALQLGLSLSAVAVLIALIVAQRTKFARGPGYDVENVITASFFVRDSMQVISTDALKRYAMAVPGARAAAAYRDKYVAPFRRTPEDDPAHHEVAAGMQLIDADLDFFTTTGIRLTRGRLPTQAEVAGRAPVMLLSEANVFNLYGRMHIADPVGHRVGIEGARRALTWYTVIGVVQDLRFGPNFEPLGVPNYTFGSPAAEHAPVALLVRVSDDPERRVRGYRDALQTFDTRAIVTDVRTVRSEVEAWKAGTRGNVIFFSIIALLALTLATVGVFGLTSYAAEVRAKEIGIRMALGASAANVTRVFISELGATAAVAAVGGLLLGSRAVFVVDAFLRDPILDRRVLSFHLLPVAGAAVALALIGAVGTFVPIRRVMRQDIVKVVHGS